jgi:hypothetical protein
MSLHIRRSADIWIVRGGHLAAQFHEHDLLDEMIITIAAVILAGAAPLFTSSIIKPPLGVVSVKPYPKVSCRCICRCGKRLELKIYSHLQRPVNHCLRLIREILDIIFRNITIA